MEDKEYISPKEQDLLLSDVKEINLRKEIAYALSVDFLSEAEGEPQWPVEGILFGHNYRAFVNMHVQIKKRPIHVFFLIDTGSPHTYLSNTTIQKLGIIDSVPESFKATIHGIIMPTVHLSPLNSHYSDINIIGTDFLSRKSFRLEVDYGIASVKILPS